MSADNSFHVFSGNQRERKADGSPAKGAINGIALEISASE